MLLALSLGLLYGFVEASEFMALSLVPRALSGPSGNSVYILWWAPVFYGVVFAVIGSIAALLASIAGRFSWETVLVFVLLLLGSFLAASMSQIISNPASMILALGIAAEGTRQYRKRREQLSATLTRAIPFLLGAVIAFLIITVGGEKTREAIAIARLPKAPTSSPNVLLLVMDTQRADHLSLYGYNRRTSPGLDSLGRGGMVFDNASANSSWTLPTHGTIFTGRLPFEHRAGLLHRPYLDSRFPTIAEALTRQGYATAGFVANTSWLGRQTRINRGFIHYEDFYGNLADAVARTVLGRRLAYEVLPRFGFVDEPGRKYAREMNRDVLSWLSSVGKRPFFAFVNYYDVHNPYLPPALFAGSFSGQSPAASLESAKKLAALATEMRAPPPPDTLRLMVGLYDESIRYLDFNIEALLDSLHRRGMLENTLVIVTSDHGESFGEHGMMEHGHSLYRDQTHVPLMIRMPPNLPAERISTVVGVHQLAATIAAIAGLPPGAFPGASLLDTAASRRENQGGVITQVGRWSLRPMRRPTSRTSLSSIVTDRWHYIRPDSGKPELYDIIADPQETHDLSMEPEQSRIIAGLQHELRLKDKRPTGDRL